MLVTKDVLGAEGNPDTQQPLSLREIGLNNFAPYIMNRLMARWNTNLSESLKKQGLSTVKMRALAVLSVSSPLTINELSVFAVTEQSTLSRMLVSLEEQGLITRTPRAEDMRIRDVEITPAGREAFDAFWPEMYQGLSDMFRDIDSEEQKAFLATLHKLLRNIRRNPI